MGKKLEINPGDIYKNWLVLEEIEQKYKRRYFLCECILCNKIYETPISTLTNKDSHFCCKGCATSKRYETKADELIGKVFGRLTIISKDSISNNHCWSYLCECSCGNRKIIKGISLTTGYTTSCGCYAKERTSETHSGENHYNWKGGISPQNTLDRIQLSRYINPIIRKRDGYTCQKCSMYGGKLNCHHIFDFSTYPELKFEPTNLIILCTTCHKEFHKIYPAKLTNTLNNLEKWMNKKYIYREALLNIYTIHYN